MDSSVRRTTSSTRSSSSLRWTFGRGRSVNPATRPLINRFRHLPTTPRSAFTSRATCVLLLPDAQSKTTRARNANACAVVRPRAYRSSSTRSPAVISRIAFGLPVFATHLRRTYRPWIHFCGESWTQDTRSATHLEEHSVHAVCGTRARPTDIGLRRWEAGSPTTRVPYGASLSLGSVLHLQLPPDDPSAHAGRNPKRRPSTGNDGGAGDGARATRRAGGSASDARGEQRAESVRHPRNRPPVGGEPRPPVHFCIS